jgi:diguanylate cyclase (GGDEF)-like protein
MGNAPLIKTFHEMTSVFDEMLASLSTLQCLGSLELKFTDEQQLVREALVALVENYGVERCALFLLHNDKLQPAAGVEWKNGEIVGCTAAEDLNFANVSSIEIAVMERALEQGHLQFFDDCLHDSHLESLAVESKGGKVIRSILCAPVAASHELVGVLLLSDPEPNAFGAWQQRFIPLFSLFLGQTLATSRLLHTLENEVKERTLRLEKVLHETQHLKVHYQKLSLVDTLTGLYNRRFFFAEAHTLVARAVRSRHSTAFLILDLDAFKRVNDRYGHKMGDIVLKDVAVALLGQLRESDVLARIGGEEFALILPETGVTGAAEFGNRLLNSIRSLHWVVDGHQLHITISVGVASMSPVDGTEPWSPSGHEDLLEKLFSRADHAMYEAKGKGGDRLVVCTF